MEMQELLNYLWVVVASALVFFMQAGFSMVESGLTRTKNCINVAIKNLTDLGISLMLYWAVGFALMFGNSRSGWIGNSHFFTEFSGANMHSLAVFFLFQAMFCSTSATIVSGAVAERMKYSSYIISTAFMAAIIYPLFGHWAWGGAGGDIISTGKGWLASIGFVDFAGSSVVHSVGGYVSLAALLVIGPRIGRYDKDGRPRKIQGTDIPMSVAGVMVLWFGWIGFNGGSTLAMNYDVPGIVLRTCLAGAAGMVAALFIGWIITGVPDVNFVMNGALAGLVAITANCHCVTGLESVIIGAIGGVVMLGATFLLEKLRIDDAVGAIPVHLAGGIWGTLAVGIFGDPAILKTTPIGGHQIYAQLIGIGVCAVWAFGTAFIFLSIVNRIRPLRVSPEDEQKGLNVAEHGASTEIYELFATMDEQARTGDLSKRLPVEPFTEIGQIATLYNKVMAGLELNTIAKDEYDEIFSNVSDGLFLIDPQFRICPNYSAATEKIFGTKNLQGKNVKPFIGDMVAPDKAQKFSDYLDLMFNREHNERSITMMNPLVATHFKINVGGILEPKLLDCSFHRVYDVTKTKVLHVMAIVRDDTRLALLAKEVRSLRAQLQPST
jgi:Amt family ammonium transporter